MLSIRGPILLATLLLLVIVGASGYVYLEISHNSQGVFCADSNVSSWVGLAITTEDCRISLWTVFSRFSIVFGLFALPIFGPLAIYWGSKYFARRSRAR